MRPHFKHYNVIFLKNNYSNALVENILRREISAWFTDYESSYFPSVCVACLVWIVGLLLGVICKKVPLLKNVL